MTVERKPTTSCVEALLGKPETFFTSVFAAQNRRPLASYTPGEIKGLMVELLGLEQIRQTGEKASQVARLLKNTLDERRRVVSGLRRRRRPDREH